MKRDIYINKTFPEGSGMKWNPRIFHLRESETFSSQIPFTTKEWVLRAVAQTKIKITSHFTSASEQNKLLG